MNLTNNQNKIIYQGEKPSCVVPITSKEILIADKNKLILFNRYTRKVSPFLEIEHPVSNMRFNDGKVDPNGRLWVGTMEMNILPHEGTLYSIDSDANIVESVKRVTISNGLAWSLDHKTMYYIDT